MIRKENKDGETCVSAGKLVTTTNKNFMSVRVEPRKARMGLDTGGDIIIINGKAWKQMIRPKSF